MVSSLSSQSTLTLLAASMPTSRSRIGPALSMSLPTEVLKNNAEHDCSDLTVSYATLFSFPFISVSVDARISIN